MLPPRTEYAARSFTMPLLKHGMDIRATHAKNLPFLHMNFPKALATVTLFGYNNTI
jgi:hypothetical protein